MYQDSGMYRQQQFEKAVSITLKTMYEEIELLWDFSFVLKVQACPKYNLAFPVLILYRDNFYDFLFLFSAISHF